jgi:integrase
MDDLPGAQQWERFNFFDHSRSKAGGTANSSTTTATSTSESYHRCCGIGCQSGLYRQRQRCLVCWRTRRACRGDERPAQEARPHQDHPGPDAPPLRCPRPLHALIGMRDAALLATMASSGARIAEVVSLTPGQLVPQGSGWMISIQGKNDTEPRLAPLSREAHALIVAWMQARPVQSVFIFTSWAGRGNHPNFPAMSQNAVRARRTSRLR